MATSIPSPPHLSRKGEQHLRTALRKAASDLPGCFLTVVSADGVLFEAQEGPLDVLHRGENIAVKGDTVIWLSSGTRFVVCLAYLFLMDHGSITLDMPLQCFSPELAEVSRQVLIGFDDDGQPAFEPANRLITLRHMLNGTSGFDAEFSGNVTKWKAWSDRGKGPVNSCKVVGLLMYNTVAGDESKMKKSALTRCEENLIYTPPSAQPGDKYTYGTSIDWLSYIFPRVAGQDLESYLQENLFHPLGISSATFYPFDSSLAGRVMPLHWMAVTSHGTCEFQEWKGQQLTHVLPQRRQDIEYPVGGAGLYATAADFARLLQNVLRGYQPDQDKATSPASARFTPLLSSKSYKVALSPDLTASQVVGLEDMLNNYFILSAEEGDTLLRAEDVNVNLLNLPMYVGQGRKGGWGRRTGSSGWGGAACTDFYIDPDTGIAVFFSTQLLPGSSERLKTLKKTLERAVYEALEM